MIMLDERRRGWWRGEDLLRHESNFDWGTSNFDGLMREMRGRSHSGGLMVVEECRQFCMFGGRAVSKIVIKKSKKTR